MKSKEIHVSGTKKFTFLLFWKDENMVFVAHNTSLPKLSSRLVSFKLGSGLIEKSISPHKKFDIIPNIAAKKYLLRYF